MGKGRTCEPETCAWAVHNALVRFEGRATADDLLNRVKRLGHWTDHTIWQEMLSHMVNSPPSYRYFSTVSPPSRFFQRDDGNYEPYNPIWHDQLQNWKRVV